jgi:hypothetical protein
VFAQVVDSGCYSLFRTCRLQLLSQAARLYTASLPAARSLRKLGGLGDAVGRFLSPSAPNLRTALLSFFRSLRKHGYSGDAVGRFLRQPALRSLLRLAITPLALPNTLPLGLAFATLPPSRPIFEL